MAKVRNWAITDLTAEDSLTVIIQTASGAKTFRVTQFSATYACNEVAQASCLVAVGRDFRQLAQALGVAALATIHQFAPLLEQMQPARIIGHFRGKETAGTDAVPDGKDWKDQPAVLFLGYLVGISRRKVNGKFHPVLHFLHKMVDLTHSSTLSSMIHPQSTISMITPACFRPTPEQGAAGQPVTLGELVGRQSLVGTIETDLWDGIKSFLMELTTDQTIDLGGMGGCVDPNQVTYAGPTYNGRAQEVLDEIEGPLYTYAVPIKIRDFGVAAVGESISDAVCGLAFMAAERTTFWDFLVTRIFPEFCLTIIPLADHALVVADCPALDQYYIEIKPEDYDEIVSESNATLPLRQVIVFGPASFSTDASTPAVPVAAGQFTVDEIAPGDGMVLSVGAPRWLEKMVNVRDFTQTTNNICNGDPITSTLDGNDKFSDVVGDAADIAMDVCKMYTAYAHTILVANTLKSRSCMLSGRLRFDISPGSLIKIAPKGDLFLDGLDVSETVLYAHVARVTVNINAEGPLANTIFQLTHVRTEKENDVIDSPRTCVDRHPLYMGLADGEEDFLGAPLVPDLV